MNRKIFFLFFIFFFINPNLQSAQLTEESSLFFNSLKGDVKEAYDYAVKNPEMLSNFSCYCGCEKIKHTSNKSCFIKEIDQDIISLTNHSVSCPICIDVALTVKYLTQDGFSLKEIRSILDDAYDGYPSTQTKLELNGGSKKSCCNE
ncbi:PCYCGC domain-containing protein [bacterium]|nr:PCYCGC domain-containing protein [bacterium]